MREKASATRYGSYFRPVCCGKAVSGVGALVSQKIGDFTGFDEEMKGFGKGTVVAISLVMKNNNHQVVEDIRGCTVKYFEILLGVVVGSGVRKVFKNRNLFFETGDRMWVVHK